MSSTGWRESVAAFDAFTEQQTSCGDRSRHFFKHRLDGPSIHLYFPGARLRQAVMRILRRGLAWMHGFSTGSSAPTGRAGRHQPRFRRQEHLRQLRLSLNRAERRGKRSWEMVVSSSYLGKWHAFIHVGGGFEPTAGTVDKARRYVGT